MSGIKGRHLDDLLTGLVRREVLGLQSDPHSPEQGQYGFLQDLLRYVAYETLSRRERRAKHLQAAGYLSDHLAEEEVAEVVASHFLDAYQLDPDADDAPVLRGQAQTALLRAGERAASLGASAEAQRYFEQAGELAGTPRDQAAAFGRAGDMALRAGVSERAGALFERAIHLHNEAGETHAAARASALLAFTEQVAGRDEQAIERMERALSVIAADEPDADLAFLLFRLGNAYFFAGDVDRAVEFIERALDLGEALQLPDILARAWSAKATIISIRRPEEAQGLFRLALDTAVAEELHERASLIHGNLSDLYLRRDRYRDSLASLERAAVILTFAIGHDQLPPSYAFAARPALDRLEAELPPEQLTAARDAAAATTLEELERTAREPNPLPARGAR